MTGSTFQTVLMAWMRGLGQAALTFVGTLFLVRQQLPDSMARGERWENAAIAAVIAACLALGWRGGIEGSLDGVRQQRNIASPADVHDDTKP